MGIVMVRLSAYGSFAMLSSVLHLGLLASASQADYNYAWTEYSLEWLVDASGSIVDGRINVCSEKGEFTIYVNQLLKKTKDFEVKDLHLVKNSCLGRATCASPELLRPVYSEPSTYPSEIRLPSPGHRIDRMKEWGSGDRCLVFFGQNAAQTLQVINLNRPVPFEDRFLLAADMRGNLIYDPDDLIARIKRRVAEGRKKTPDRSDRVRTDAMHYLAFGMPLDGHSYYGLVVPPDEGLKDRFRKDASMDGEETRWSWYWFYSGKTPRDFRADWRQDFDKMVRGCRDQRKMRSGFGTCKEQTAYYLRNDRNYPDGWSCVISHDGRHLALADANYLYLYDVQEEDPRRAKLLYKADNVDLRECKMRFSPNKDLFSYTKADRTLVDFDLSTRKIKNTNGNAGRSAGR